MTKPLQVLLISGSVRAASTNTAVLTTVQHIAPEGVRAVMYTGLARLPHFNPDDDRDPLHPEVAALRTHIKAADALLFSTPEYAGSLPGSFKNLLDWSIGGGEMNGQPVAWINAAGCGAPTGAVDAHATLLKVLSYTGSVVVEGACMRLPVERRMVGNQDTITDPAVRTQLMVVIEQLARHLRAASS
ncbi:NAD(P)H-dependent oxidoreductase [Deinococcus sp. Arct2-2]|uniref:NADPH-dependent FMN reductase n=1 Tax=Deinococcus sp. Arct2-2 TaxID=2568653 RepID=UPI0010A47351|nr:NADPH-dependent FMN reductase [Deinococcus sp. Arct2-2]THF67872.1 NAD(P)H-dependent oxidoreductase [Deinococcus sp. Arct2-2]